MEAPGFDLNPILQVLPPGVYTALATEQEDAAGHESEIERLRPSAGAKRRMEFFLGRLAAGRALDAAGFNHIKFPLPTLASGTPDWPSGVVGSITHKAGVALSSVGETKTFRAIGIDLEKVITPKFLGIETRICNSEELGWVGEFVNLRQLRLTQLFSVKEAVYKATSPLFDLRLGFHDVSFDPHQSLARVKQPPQRQVPPVRVISVPLETFVFSAAFIE